MTPLRSRGAVVVAVAVTAFAVLALGTRTWVDAAVAQPLGGDGQVAVPGSQAAPVVPALALVALACAGALTIAHRVTRFVVLGVVVLAGLGALTAAALAVADPQAAARPAVAEATGLTTASVTPDDATVALTPWPFVVLALALVLVLLAVRGLVVARHWPGRRRFDAASAGPVRPAEDDPAGDDPADTWDALTRGDDPTGRRD